ncbi:unnamed protein product [Brassicogethes aeneus]|uniref:SAM domain-containing protein n=1 Tax=Brassicogethes aeneus TaxID=1431903 RepID=A0A9P0B8R3_BRAAE|nr:unnamed protein product [Brassicogethes aeneus]
MNFEKHLSEWGLSSYIEIFQDEGIDDESFTLLDEETINKIFSKSGPRLKFKKYFSNLTNSQSYVNVENVENFNPIYSQSTLSTLSVDTGSSDSIIFEPDNDLLEIIKRPLEEISTNSIITKKIKLDDFNLENVLKLCPEGQIILAGRNRLNNDLRQKISKVVVNHLISQEALNKSKLEIKTEQFIEAAKAIVKLFPGELEETYFTPYIASTHGLRCQQARGKLWSRYINLKAALRMSNSQQLKSPSTTTKPLNEEEESKLTFLNSAIEPYHKILSLWEDTYNLRNNIYKNKSIEDIYKDFPCLKEAYGIELWPVVAEAIVKEANDRKLCVGFELEDTTLQALQILPYLFSTITVINSKKGFWRPSRSEVQESFFLIVNNFDDIQKKIETRRKRLASYELPLQPFAAAIIKGDKLDSLFIFINNVFYNCKSSLRCLELLYKAFFALNLQYPPECKHIWHLIQELVFKTKSPKASTTACVISDILSHIKK